MKEKSSGTLANISDRTIDVTVIRYLCRFLLRHGCDSTLSLSLKIKRIVG